MVDQDLVLKTKINIFKAVLALDPQASVFAELGQAYLEAGEPGKAAEICGNGLAYHPDLLQARITLIEALLALDRIDEAKEALASARNEIDSTAKYIEQLNTFEGELTRLDPDIEEPRPEDSLSEELTTCQTDDSEKTNADTKDVTQDDIQSIIDQETESADNITVDKAVEDEEDIDFEALDEELFIDDAQQFLDEIEANLESDSEDDVSIETQLELDSLTLANLYIEQGLTEEALAVCRRLLENDPDNEEIKAKISSIEDAPDSDHKSRLLEALVRWRDNIRSRRQSVSA